MQFWIRSDILKKKSMDSEWEGQMLKDGESKEDEDLQKAYVNAVNNSDLSKTITKTTVQLLCSFDTMDT